MREPSVAKQTYVRDVVKIDEELCTGCGQCVPACAEGAIQIVDGKARLVADNLCDGLGACLGDCPEGAITIERREAIAYDEQAVELHLQLQRQGEQSVLTDHPSELRQWPIQLHLVPPTAPYFRDADVLLAADCVAFAIGDFHRAHLRGRSLAIACPKLDQNQGIYFEKLKAMIDRGGICKLTVMVMEVPCCEGLVRLARQAAAAASRKVPLRRVEVGLKGDILRESQL